MRKVKLVIAFIVFLSSDFATAGPFSRLWVFGDSTVDTGWYKVEQPDGTYSGSQKFDMYLSDAVANGFGKPTSSPGPISVQTLAGQLGLHASPQNQNGTNYATSGARNNESNRQTIPAPSCNDVLSGYFPNAVPTAQQISNYLQTHTPSGNALYVISSGGNDVSYVVTQLKHGLYDTSQAKSCLDDAASKLANAISTLQSHNAKYIIIASQVNSFGDTKTRTYRGRYNKILMTDLNNLGVKYAWGRVNAVRKLISSSQNPFNFTYTTPRNPACTTPAGFTSSWALLCTSDMSAPSESTLDPSRTLFADNEHWASRGERILGSYYYCLAKNKWSNLFHGYTAKPPFACSNFSSLF